jgi:CHAT domain-containing protein
LELKNLYRPKSEKTQNQTLIAGLSKPDGPSIDNLPKRIVSNLTGRIDQNDKSDGQSNNAQETRSKLVTALSLPSVEKEVAEIGNLTKTQPLLNQKFTADAFKNDVESANFSTVHIASHGYFGKNIKDSFIMAYDKNLNFQDFEKTINIDKLKQNPIELLALSACDTAGSNDRMILGFSGLAVKSNALSAVGSLWSINDDAALQLMTNFYTNMSQSKSRAQALQEAQVSMIKSKKYNHPYYWSPFVLIGNWR